jgi:hypothetical protein
MPVRDPDYAEWELGYERPGGWCNEFDFYDEDGGLYALDYGRAVALARLLYRHGVEVTIRGWIDCDFDHFVYNPGTGTLEVDDE